MDTCKDCNGTGIINALSPVYEGEPHLADVGSQPCATCQDVEPDDFSGATEGDR